MAVGFIDWFGWQPALILFGSIDASDIAVVDRAGRRERLLDADVFRNVLAKAGAELVLHGHEHVSSVTWLDGPERRIPAVGVPSASAAPGGRWQPAGYNLYRIEGEPDAWHCEMVARGFRPGSGTIGELGRRVSLRPS